VSTVEPIDELASRRRLAALSREHHAFLLKLARKLCRSNFDPEDLVQDVLLKAVAHHDRMPPDVNHAAWMARVMRNLFIDRVRSRAAQPKPVDLDEVVLPVPDPDQREWWEELTAEEIRAALLQIPEELRGAFERFAFERQSYKEISAALGIPAATVGTRVLRARRHLRAVLGGAQP
jgi:RNA polymerase sigma-70 factor, ECF subfamily